MAEHCMQTCRCLSIKYGEAASNLDVGGDEKLKLTLAMWHKRIDKI